MSNKRLLAGGIVRDLCFTNQAVYEAYLSDLGYAQKPYVVMNRWDCDDGCVIVRILQQYNNCDLIELCGDLSEIYSDDRMALRRIDQYERFLVLMDQFRAEHPDLFACLRSASCNVEVPGNE